MCTRACAHAGYGDPGAAQWRSLPLEDRLRTVDFKDTFLNAQHLREAFPDYQVGWCGGGNSCRGQLGRGRQGIAL